MKAYTVPSALVHPFDLDRFQIDLHKEQTYIQKKGAKPDALKPPSAPLKEVLESICSMVKLPKSVLKNIEAQFNLSSHQEQEQGSNYDKDKHKITFSDFLQLLQREAFFRDALSEAQIYRLSANRFVYNQECPLLTMQQLEQLNIQKKEGAGDDSAISKLPNFSYMIENMVMFQFKGIVHLLVSFENKSVQIFEYDTGHSIYEFDFTTCTRTKKTQETENIGSSTSTTNNTNSTNNNNSNNISKKYTRNASIDLPSSNSQLLSPDSIFKQPTSVLKKQKTIFDRRQTFKSAHISSDKSVEFTDAPISQPLQPISGLTRNQSRDRARTFATPQRTKNLKTELATVTEVTTTTPSHLAVNTAGLSPMVVGGRRTQQPKLTKMAKSAAQPMLLDQIGKTHKQTNKAALDCHKTAPRVPLKENLAQSVLGKFIIPTMVNTEGAIEEMTQVTKKKVQIQGQRQYDFQVLGIDSIDEVNRTFTGGGGGASNFDSMQNPVESFFRTNMKDKKSERVLELINHHRRFRPKDNYGIDDSLFEFVNQGATFERISNWNYKYAEVDKDIRDLEMELTRRQNLADVSVRTNMSKKTEQQEQQEQSKKIQEKMYQLDQSKHRVQIRTEDLRNRIRDGHAVDKNGKPISCITLMNKMAILNSAADKIKYIEKLQEQDKASESTAQVTYDLQQMMDDDESNNKHLVQKNTRLYQQLFPGKELQIHDVIQRPKPEPKQNTSSVNLTRTKEMPPELGKSYPMAMKMFQTESIDLVIFALVSDLVIYEVKQSGVKKVFRQVLTHRLDSKDEFLPTHVDVQISKVKKCLQVCIAAISSKLNKEETNDYVIIILEIDQNNDYKVTENFDKSSNNNQVRRKSKKPMITKVLFCEAGLIVSCFSGYIELFDTIDFTSKGKWDNCTELVHAVGSKKDTDEDGSRPIKVNNNIDDDLGLGEMNFGQTQKISKHSGFEDAMRATMIDAMNTKKKVKVIEEPFQRRCCSQQKTSFANTRGGRNGTMMLTSKDEKLTPQRKTSTRSAMNTRKKQENSSKKERKTGTNATVDCLDYSKALDLIAFGGVSGSIGVLDSTTLSFKGLYPAHAGDVSALYFHDSELQMISMSVEGEIALWDAQKMTIIQTVRNKAYMQTNSINCTAFFPTTGTMLLGTTKLFRWQLKEDIQARVQIEQQSAVARDFLKQYRRGLKRQGILRNQLDQNEVDPSSDSELRGMDKFNNSESTADQTARDEQFAADLMQGKSVTTVMPTQAYIEAIYREENLASKINPQNVKPNKNVLPTTSTQLVGCFYHSSDKQVFTLDADSLIRQWDLKRGNCLRSYPLEIMNDGSQTKADVGLAFQHKTKIQTARLANDEKTLLVAFEGGLIQLHNLYTGTLLFNKTVDEQLALDTEVSALAFFQSQSNYWFVASCWEGRVAFFSKPLSLNGKEFVQCKRTKSNHKRDVVCVDITDQNNVVTGSIDNVICLWQSFSGKVQKAITMPFNMADPMKRYIQNVKFALRESNEFVLIIMSDGIVYAVETLTESFLTNSKGQQEIATIARYPLVDLKMGLFLTLGENGLNGKLHSLQIERGTKKDPDLNRVNLHLINEFCYSLPTSNGPPKKLPPEQSVFKIELMPKQGMVIVAQVNGTVSFLNMNQNLQRVCQLNDSKWDMNFNQRFNMAYEIANLNVQQTKKKIMKVLAQAEDLDFSEDSL